MYRSLFGHEMVSRESRKDFPPPPIYGNFVPHQKRRFYIKINVNFLLTSNERKFFAVYGFWTLVLVLIEFYISVGVVQV